jgi:ferredoxin-NADP reductase
MVDMTTAHLPAGAGGRPAGLGRTLRERVRTAARSVAESAVTPLDLDDLLDHFHPLRRGAELSGRVLEVVPETAQSATLVIKPGRDWAGHVPGQYVRVGVDVEGVRLWRTYSLTHGPRADGSISITVKAIEGGTVSNHLVHRTAPGTMLRLAQADGDFVLPQPLPAKLLLVTAGSGITPVIGMLRNLFSRATPPTTDIVLIHSALSRAEVIFAEEIRGYAARGLIRLVELHADTDGLLDVDSLDELVPDLTDRPTYACGPAGLLDALEAHHGSRGLAIHTERFRPVTVAAPG